MDVWLDIMTVWVTILNLYMNRSLMPNTLCVIDCIFTGFLLFTIAIRYRLAHNETRHKRTLCMREPVNLLISLRPQGFYESNSVDGSVWERLKHANLWIGWFLSHNLQVIQSKSPTLAKIASILCLLMSQIRQLTGTHFSVFCVPKINLNFTLVIL